MEQREWIGGLIETCFSVEDRDPPYRPLAVFWIDMSDGVLVGADVVIPGEESGAVGRLLSMALIDPMQGPRRRPDRIRVASDTLAAEVREVFDGLPGDGPRIAVAPTPELEAVIDQIASLPPVLDDGEEDDEDVITTYLAMSDVRPGSVAAMFVAAETLYRLAPWTHLDERQVIRLDIPDLGVTGACISIIGGLGQGRGLTIFPSFEGYEAFLDAAADMMLTPLPMDLGTDGISLTFEPDTDLPDALRQEAQAHRWPVAAADAFPVLDGFRADGRRRLLRDLDFQVVAAAVTALGSFIEAEGDRLESAGFEPVRSTLHLGRIDAGGEVGDPGDDLTVDLCIPYQAFDHFVMPGDDDPGLDEPGSGQPGLDEPGSDQPSSVLSSPPTLGRNDPCHCGSGRKDKRCHMAEDEERRIADIRPGENVEERLMRKLIDYASRVVPGAWLEHERAFNDPREAALLAIPWALYGFEIGSRTVLERYLQEEAWRLSTAERELAAAERAAWLSIWEVVAVEPGESLWLRDALTGLERRIHEPGDARPEMQGLFLLARIVDRDGVANASGAHPYTLPPRFAERVAEKARRYLRRRRDVPVERMRSGKVGRYLIRRWEDALDDLEMEFALGDSGGPEGPGDSPAPGARSGRRRQRKQDGWPDAEQGELDLH